MKKQSNAQKIRWFVKDLLDDCKPHTAKEIKEYVIERSGQQFTDGAFAGALRDLVAKDTSYQVIDRGVYQLAGFDNMDTDTEFEILALNSIKILKNTNQELEKEVNKIKIMTASNDTFNLILEIKEISEALARFSDEISLAHHDWLEKQNKE